MNLSTKTFVVTGATSGIGFSTVEMLARAGAVVIGVGRSQERCVEVEKQIRNQTRNHRVHYLLADLSIQENVKSLSTQIIELLASYGKNSLEGIANNAGVFTNGLTLTTDGIEMQWAVNHLAPFLLTQLLLPSFTASSFARIVTVSSDSHYTGRINWADPQFLQHYNGLQAYGATKLANILFTLELNQRLGNSSNVRAFALDPGLVKTDIGMKGTPSLTRLLWKLRRSGGTTPDIPARGIVFLLTEPTIQKSQELYWKDCHPKRSSNTSLDTKNAGRLWALSEKMCGFVKKEENETLGNT